MAADVKVYEKPSLCLDSSGCVSLQDILVAFNAPISEEHAWALCFECIKCFQNVLQEHGKCLVVSEPEHVILHKDGQVHIRTVWDNSTPSTSTKNDGARPFTSSEQKLVFHLGLTLFRALEFGFQEEEERRLGADLERLIDHMTAEQVSGEEAGSERPETDDEGIEQDSGEATDEAVPRGSSNPANSAPPDNGPLHTVLTRVLEHCTTRQASLNRAHAESHYRAVCRALVAEALELASFLERVSQGTQSLPCVQVNPDTCHDLDQLKFADWARLWMQVIQELRHGVQLKKVRDGSIGQRTRPSPAASIEYELTPYEILMDDIRARRYKLNKVMVDGELPQRVKKDAHAIILEFIRSRPPLRKASERKLAPAPNRASSPRELLMESIKQEHRLRPSQSPVKRIHGATKCPVPSLLVPIDQESQGEDSPSAVSSGDETGDDDECGEICLGSSPEDCVAEFSFWSAKRDPKPQNKVLLQEPARDEGTPMRRLIQVDFTEFQGDIDDDDDEDLICSLDSPTTPNVPTPAPRTIQANPWRRTDSTSSRGSAGTPSASGSHLKLRYDLGDLLAGSRASGFLTGEPSTIEETSAPAAQTTERPASLLLDSYDLATQCPSRRSTLRRRHTVATTAEQINELENGLVDDGPDKKCHQDAERGEEAEEEEEDSHTHTSLGSCELNWSRSSLQDELLQSSHWQSAMECLSLTLEEIVHIRSVLTKAELESLPVEGRIKEEVEKRKVCFLCLKTRFGIFGPWGQKCKLCKRTVCAKCCSKMRIPTEHFSRVPVFALSPGLSSPEGSEDGSNSPTFTRSLMARLLHPSAPTTVSSTSPAKSPPQAPQRFNSVGSAPTSPSTTRRTKPSIENSPANGLSSTPVHQQLPSISPSKDHEQPQSLPVTTANNKDTSAQRGKLLRSKTLGRPGGSTAEKLKGLQMTVCLDCKAMVLQIIKTSRKTSRTHAIKNLSLNLSPVY